MKRALRVFAGPLATLLVLGGCAAGGGHGAAKTPKSRSAGDAAAVDSATVLLWRFDESGGVRVADASANHYDGRAGVDTRPEFGRIRGARTFVRSVDSFAYLENLPALDLPDTLTIEAWIRLDDIGPYEDTPIAMRWNPRRAWRSWIFSVGGRSLQPPSVTVASPGDHLEILPSSFGAQAGKLMFAFMPGNAGAPRAFFSTRVIEIGRWTHVAATFDSRVVRLFIDGRLDAQYAVNGTIRPSPAPLLVGNAFDTRQLSTFGGELRLSPEYDHTAYYAFVGAIDELRLSRVARTEFPGVR